MVPDTPEHGYDTKTINDDEITCIPENPQTETVTHISTDIFYTSCSTARKLNFDIIEIKDLGKTYYFKYNILY